MNFSQTLEHLQTTDSALNSSSLFNLSKIEPDELEQLTAMWSLIPMARRRTLVQALVEITEESFEVDFESVFRWGLRDDDPDVRATCVEGLWENEDPRLMTDFATLLIADPSNRVRAAAASSLGRFLLLGELGKLPFERCHAAYETLCEIIREEHEPLDLRRRALESVAYVGDDEVVALLEDAYDHPEEKMRISAIFGMGRSADVRWIETAMMELLSIDPEMRYEAARTCGELQARAAVPRLAELIDDPAPEVREAAVWALGQAGGETARRFLLTCCTEGDEETRSAAEEALAELEFFHSQFDFPLYVLDDAASDQV